MQRTAYVVRISDWSSDVCSSDLRLRDIVEHLGLALLVAHRRARALDPRRGVHIAKAADEQGDEGAVDIIDAGAHLGHRLAVFGLFRDGHADAFNGFFPCVEPGVEPEPPDLTLRALPSSRAPSQWTPHPGEAVVAHVFFHAVRSGTRRNPSAHSKLETTYVEAQERKV